MAESVISFALEQLATVIQDEARLVLGVEEEIEKLTTTLTAIQAVLNDAEKKQFKDKLVKIWLEEFNDAAYDMDDVLDKWNYEILKSRMEGDHQATRRKVIPYLHSLCSCFSKVASHHNIASKIKEIREKLDWIDSEKNKYSFTNTVHSHETNKSHDKRLINSSLIDASQVYGRVSDKEIILSRLLGESSSSNQQEIDSPLDHPGVIAIVAMGGMGKTTLAQLIVNNDRLKVQFEKTMWVCVSHPFDLTTITKTIIQEVNNKVPESSFGWNALHHVLRDSIKDKRFLLVLDDVWTDDYTEWEPLKIALEYGAPGSRILVTTRNEKVAKMMRASYTHPLGQLSDDECSTLLCRIALKDRKQEDVDVLKGIGIEISKKCKGLPLAAKALGGLLRFKVHAQDWKTIMKSEIWELEEVEQGLLLSYYDLPSPLKSCLAYCSIFPKDYRIEKDVLIKQWMAQGFLKCSTKKKEEMETVGEEYLCNLANRSFFQDFRKGDCNENIISFKMHDLIHDLAQFLMKSESLVMLSSNTELFPSSKVRHFTLVCDRDGEQPNNSVLTSSLYEANSTIRTLQVINGRELMGEDISSDFFLRYRCLRVLSLSELHLTDLSSEMNKLMHLRYLDLNNNDFQELPEELTTLYNLQTLILEGCELLCKLPSRMERLVNLRHLNIKKTRSLNHIPQEIGKLTRLRTLTNFKVVGSCTSDDDGSISILRGLNLLRGDLVVSGLGRMEAVNEAFKGVLMNKEHLHSLTLVFITEGISHDLEKITEGVIGGLEPHPNLVQLEIQNYLGLKLPSWCVGEASVLMHLRTLKLCGLINCTELPGLGQLPCLEELRLLNLRKLKRIGFEFYGISNCGGQHVNRVVFPKLERFRLESLVELEEWEFGLKEKLMIVNNIMPRLHEAQIVDCMKLKTWSWRALSQLPSLNKLTVSNASGFIEYIGGDFCDHVDCDKKYEMLRRMVRDEAAVSLFPSVKHLSIDCMENMKGFKLAVCMGSVKEEFKLTAILPSLTHLELSHCETIKLRPRNLLESLVLRNFSSLPWIAISLKNLKHLTISGSSDWELIEALALVASFDLETLEIEDCSDITSMPEEVKDILMSHIPNITIEGERVQ